MSYKRLSILLPIMTTPITSSTTTMVVTLLSTNHSRICCNEAVHSRRCHQVG